MTSARLLSLVPPLLVAVAVLVVVPVAWLATGWQQPERIPGYGVEDWPPYLVADRDRTVHAFGQQVVNGQTAVIYSRWTIGQGWSEPVDVVLSPHPTRQGSISGAFLDEAGAVHLAFFGGNEQAAGMYYLRAPAAAAGRTTAWSRGKQVGPDAGPLGAAALAGDGKGSLFIVYGGKREGIGLYAVYSTDGGDTWSDPAAIFLNDRDKTWPADLRLAVDPEGVLHAVWDVVNQGGNGDAVYYARLDVGRGQWSQPVVLAVRDPDEYSARWPAIISFKNEVVVVYQDGRTATLWMRRSPDGGVNWTEPARVSTSVGEYGHPALLVDSASTLHMILGSRFSDQVHGMWHSVWNGTRWSDLEAVVSGPRTDQFDPNNPQAVIVQGSTLLATWKSHYVWSSFATLDAPALQIVPLPTPLPTAPATLTPARPAATVPAGLPKPTATARATPGMPQPESPAMPSALDPLLVGVLPVALLIGVIAVTRLRR